MKQKLILIEHVPAAILIAGPEYTDLELSQVPEDLQVAGEPERRDDGWHLAITAGSRRLDYRPLAVKASFMGKTIETAIPTRILADKELFLCVTTTSNFHWGSAVDRIQEMEAAGVPWQEWCGDPLIHHGHNFDASRRMAEMAHAEGFPVTFMLDDQTARAGAPLLADWHTRFGDDVGVMPSSYWHQNSINYNLERPCADAIEVLRQTKRSVVNALAEHGLFMDPLVCGFDQWIGAFGTNWAGAARACRFRGVWGMCFDHLGIDTSCMHEGMPWDVFRSSPTFYRYPARATESLWGFPWTIYDLCNSFLEYHNASGTYNTEWMEIHQHQPDYYDRNLETRLDSLASCDVGCFVVHDEDHDIWRPDLLEPMRAFLSRVPRDRVVPATLEEVTQWLELRFADGSHPANLVEAADPLRCHEWMADMRRDLVENSPDFCTNVSWTMPQPAHWQTVDGHNPTVLNYYDADCRWSVKEGENTPMQYIDYRKSTGLDPTGLVPKEPVPVLTGWQEETISRSGSPVLQVRFHSDIPFSRLPLVFWDRPEIRGDLRTARARVVFLDVTAGANSCELAMESK